MLLNVLHVKDNIFKRKVKEVKGIQIEKWISIFDWIFVSPPNSHVEALTPTVMACEAGPSGDNWVEMRS